MTLKSPLAKQAILSNVSTALLTAYAEGFSIADANARHYERSEVVSLTLETFIQMQVGDFFIILLRNDESHRPCSTNLVTVTASVVKQSPCCLRVFLK